ncbi:hypothetical protein MKEN_00042000 [Mycena kentingensis (nom. inval.)]|nr:hypothetical protein MKEN_00042000 [Mycena kentingensis (nom. inval.)]
MVEDEVGDARGQDFCLAAAWPSEDLEWKTGVVDDGLALGLIHALTPTINMDAEALQIALDTAPFDLPKRVEQFSAAEGIDTRDPQVVVQDLKDQTTHLRKLKFRYLEQNAKGKYVRVIVSDVDDATLVAPEDNKAMEAECAQKKARLKTAKQELAEGREEYRALVAEVEPEYRQLKESAQRAALLKQKIIDARLALTRLRQAHPQPHLTITAADERLAEQITEMQTLSDTIAETHNKIAAMKGSVKADTQEIEKLRTERAELEKAVKAARVNEDDGRLVPLYDKHLASLSLNKLLVSASEFDFISDNDLQINYTIERRPISIVLSFQPNTRQLASAAVSGMDEIGVDVSEQVDLYTRSNDAQGLVASVLSLARAAIASA